MIQTHLSTTRPPGPAILNMKVRCLPLSQASVILARCSHMHYRAGRPATFAQLLGAFDEAHNRCVGVLCVSHPTLNAPWRARAWPELFEHLRDLTSLASTVNLYVRTIARVIVHPTYRGVGVASLLVRTYLDHPLTPLTEALASMGHASPLFKRCGMREVPCPRSRRDRRLAMVLRQRGLSPLALISLDATTKALLSECDLTQEVLVWAKASKSTRGRVPRARDAGMIARLLMLACAGLVARPVVLVTP